MNTPLAAKETRADNRKMTIFNISLILLEMISDQVMFSMISDLAMYSNKVINNLINFLQELAREGRVTLLLTLWEVWRRRDKVLVRKESRESQQLEERKVLRPNHLSLLFLGKLRKAKEKCLKEKESHLKASREIKEISISKGYHSIKME